MTKEEILRQMKEKHGISDEKTNEFNNEFKQNQNNNNICSIDDSECLTCGS